MRSGRIIRKINKLVSEDSICLGIDDANVCGAGMWCADFDGHGEDLAGREGLDVCGVVLKHVAFAEGEVARSCVEIFLGLADLEFGLDVALIVAGLVVEDLFAACCFQSWAGLTRWW